MAAVKSFILGGFLGPLETILCMVSKGLYGVVHSIKSFSVSLQSASENWPLKGQFS